MAAAHAHSRYGKSWATLARLLDPITQDACAFYEDHGLFADFTGVVHAQWLAEAAGDPVKIEHAYAIATRTQVGSPLAGWFRFQPLFAQIVREQPDLLGYFRGSVFFADGPLRLAACLAPRHRTAMAQLVLDSPGALKDFVGREIAVSDWFTVTQDRIGLFAEATEDRQWIHVDPERARRESPFHTTVAHGFLTLSLISLFLRQSIQIRGGLRLTVNYGLNRVRFPSPVASGAKIRGRIALLSVKEIAEEALEAVFTITVGCHGSEKPCCVAEAIVRYYT